MSRLVDYFIVTGYDHEKDRKLNHAVGEEFHFTLLDFFAQKQYLLC